MDKVHHLISDRWSPVAFDARQVNEDRIHLLFEAAGWAPSARNAQPWRFIYTTSDMPDYSIFLNLMSEPNRVWASTAPLLVMPLARVISEYKDRPNRLAFYEVGMAVGNLLAQVTAMGLLAHQLAGYDLERAREVLEIPANFEPMCIMAIGYKGDASKLPEEVAARERVERTRLEVSAFIFKGKFGQVRS